MNERFLAGNWVWTRSSQALTHRHAMFLWWEGAPRAEKVDEAKRSPSMALFVQPTSCDKSPEAFAAQLVESYPRLK